MVLPLYKSSPHSEIKPTATWMTSLPLILPQSICTALQVSPHYKPFHKATASTETCTASHLFSPVLKALPNQPTINWFLPLPCMFLPLTGSLMYCRLCLLKLCLSPKIPSPAPLDHPSPCQFVWGPALVLYL